MSLKGSYLELELDAKRDNDNERFLAADNLTTVALRPIAPFSENLGSSISGKQIQWVEYAHIAFLFYILITSARSNNDFSIGFALEINERPEEGTVEKIPVWVLLKDIFGFCRPSGECKIE